MLASKGASAAAVVSAESRGKVRELSSGMPRWAAPLTSRPPKAWLPIRVLGLAVTLFTAHQEVLGSGSATAELTLVVASAVTIAGCGLWSLGPRNLVSTGLTAMMLSWGVMIMVAPTGAVAIMGGVIAYAAAVDLPTPGSLAIVCLGTISLVVTYLVTSPDDASRLLLVLVIAGLWWAGLSHREYLLRAEQAELLLAESIRATEASATAAALAERARIAREIHDILAHSLSALSIQLEAASGFLGDAEQRKSHPHGDKLAQSLDRARHLAREGLVETRRAVHALREDAAPLSDLLNSLIATNGDHISVRVHGRRRPVAPEAGLTLYRITQEALTNARKHAPSSPVRVDLSFGEDHVTLEVDNALPPSDEDRPLTDSGAHCGLTGLRERTELAGGSLSAGPDGDRWLVQARIPA